MVVLRFGFCSGSLSEHLPAHRPIRAGRYDVGHLTVDRRAARGADREHHGAVEVAVLLLAITDQPVLLEGRPLLPLLIDHEDRRGCPLEGIAFLATLPTLQCG